MAEGTSNELILILVTGTLGMLILAMGIFFFFVIYQKRLISKQLELNQIRSKQQEELLRTSMMVQERERKRFAEDLHDDIGAMLSVIKLNLNRLEKKSDEGEVRIIAGDTKNNLDQVIHQIRRITRDLLPPSLERFGLGSAVQELIEWLPDTVSLRVVCIESGEIRRFESSREMAVFRIIQELLNNSLKYSEASRIDIRMRYGQEFLCVVVSDNGKGYDINEAKGKGLGLQNLEGRANVIQARLKLKSWPRKGSAGILVVRI